MTNPHDFDDTQALFKAALADAFSSLSASNDPLWVEADQQTRRHLARMVAENRMVSLGYVPSSWRHRGLCRRCGPVPLEEPCEQELVACPWCVVGATPSVFSFV